MEKAVHVAEVTAIACVNAHNATAAATDAANVHPYTAVADTAAYAAFAAAADTADAFSDAAYADAYTAVDRANHAGVPLADIHRDFTTILELARKHGWTDDTPVPPSVFGPLEEPSKGHQLEVKLQVPADWTVEQIRRYVAELSNRVDDVHRAAGGKGLKVSDLEILEDAVVAAGVKS